MKTIDGVEHTAGMTLYIIENERILTRHDTRLQHGNIYTSNFQDHLYGKKSPGAYYGKYTEALQELIRIVKAANARRVEALEKEYRDLLGVE